MSAENGPRSTAYTQTIKQAIIFMHAARKQYRKESNRHGAASTDTLEQFERAVLDLYDELYPYRNESSAGDFWEDNDLAHLPHICGQVRSASEIKTQGGKLRVKSDNVINHAPGNILQQYSHALDEFAFKIGFAPDPKQPVADPEEAEV